MKVFFLILTSTFFFVAGARADAHSKFSCVEVAAIRSQSTSGGQHFVVKFEDKTADCRTYADTKIPGWKCLLKYKNGTEFQLSSEDTQMISGNMRPRAAGEIATFKTPGLEVWCANNGPDEKPGYRCYFN